MKNIKKMITAATLMMVLMVGTGFGGVLVHLNETPETPLPCSAETSRGGVILSDVTGVLVHLTFGVLVHVSRTDTTTECGVIVH